MNLFDSISIIYHCGYLLNICKSIHNPRPNIKKAEIDFRYINMIFIKLPVLVGALASSIEASIFMWKANPIFVSNRSHVPLKLFKI